MMEAVYALLTERARKLQRLIESSTSNGKPPWRAVIAFAGPPGSGKTTIAAEVVRRLTNGDKSPTAVVVPMDGFHYSQATLDTFPNTAEAYERRGAAWTFDAYGSVDLFMTLNHTRTLSRNQAPDVKAPSFDHAMKDPVENAITITPDVSLVIVEGNWLLYDEDPWRTISGLADETWFVDVDRDMARTRVARRHLQSGIEPCWETALARAERNDLPNGEEVRRRLIRPDVIVNSVEENLTM